MSRHYMEVEVHLSDFDDDELVKELRSRSVDYDHIRHDPLVYELFLEYTNGTKEQFDKILRKFFLDRLGKRV